MVSSSRYISCGTYPILNCQFIKFSSIFSPSTRIFPFVGFSKPSNKLINVLFPAPELPIIATLLSFKISKLISVRVLFTLLGYLKLTLLKTIFLLKEKSLSIGEFFHS